MIEFLKLLAVLPLLIGIVLVYFLPFILGGYLILHDNIVGGVALIWSFIGICTVFNDWTKKAKEND